MYSRLILSLGAVVLAGAAFAAPRHARPAKMNGTDRTFMTTLARAGAAEIEAGQVAAQRGDRFSKRYGRQMVRDHQRAAIQLSRLATKLNVDLPSAPAPEDAAAIHRMEKMSPGKFNPAYHHFAVMSHEGAINLFKNEIANGQNPRVRSWARKSLPMIEHHYHEAEAMHVS